MHYAYFKTVSLCFVNHSKQSFFTGVQCLSCSQIGHSAMLGSYTAVKDIYKTIYIYHIVLETVFII